MELTRRGLITGLVSFVAAPAIVRASSLMPVKAWAEPLIVGPEMTATEVLRRQQEWARQFARKLLDRAANPPWVADGDRLLYPLPPSDEAVRMALDILAAT